MHTDGYSRHSLPLAQKLLFRKACCVLYARALSLSLFCIFCHRKSSELRRAAIYRVMWSCTESYIGVRRVPPDANLGL